MHQTMRFRTESDAWIHTRNININPKMPKVIVSLSWNDVSKVRLYALTKMICCKLHLYSIF